MPFTREQVETVASQFPEQSQPLLQQWVFGMYGPVMLQIQTFELQLASLDLIVTAKPGNATTPKGVQRQVDRRMKKMRHLLEAASPEEVKRELKDHIDPELLAEIEFLIGWRNRLRTVIFANG